MSEQELQLILLVRDYPLITAEQLQRLTGRPWLNAIERSLLKLIRDGYLQRNKRENINTKYVYALTKKAAQEKHIGGKVIDLSERKDFTLKHEIFINEVHIDLRDRLRVWKQGRELWKNGVQPDAFFQVQQGENVRSFFLEAERQTNNPEFFREKIQGYVHLRESRGYEHLGIRTFSLLVVTLDEAHATRLAQESSALIEPKDRKLYLFSSLPIQDCIVPHDSARYPLMPV